MRAVNRIVNAQAFVDELFQMADQFPGQPVAIVRTGDGFQVGVMSTVNPQGDDWFYDPVDVEKLNVKPSTIKPNEQ